jgi:hypothetical protein
MNTTVPMSLDRLRALLEAYGADPDRWPPEERNAALALLAQTPEAQRWRDASARLDALLDQAPAYGGSPALIARILAATPAPAPTTIRTPPANRRLTRRLRAWPAIASAIPLAAAAALVLWLSTKPSHGPERVNVNLAEIETYETATDALLDAPSLQALDRLPTFGCTGSGFGCVDLNEPNDAAQSAADLERYV